MTDRSETELPPSVNTQPFDNTKVKRTSFSILGAISVSHLLNDMIQSLILAIYPLLQAEFSLSFAQIGLITLTYQLTASLLQPLIGLYTDKHPQPYSLPIGMGFTLSGILLLAVATTFPGGFTWHAALVGTGSSVFHPESSRVAARLPVAATVWLSLFLGGRQFRQRLGPLLAAILIAPYGKGNVGWFSLAALLAIVVLLQVSKWYQQQQRATYGKVVKVSSAKILPKKTVISALAILMVLIFSKYFYLTSISSYYTFYLMHKFGVSVQNAQIHLFVFLFAVAAGTIIGGPLGDRIGRKYVIWGSILGVAPFTLILPYVSLYWTGVLTVIIGLILASAFSAILVYAQELIPGKVGMVSGLFFGFAFGMGGLGAAVLGYVADLTSIELVYQICAFLPLLGIITVFLPNIEDK
uniref:RosA n=1 Tax=Yersinia enterocolitica (type O:8) TaxID=34054 RepID=Q56877_YEREN|nr:RosA [Yersinia enterocolitica (type O:8)]